MDLKNILKTLNLNKDTISMVLGALVLATLTISLINFVKNRTATVQYKNQNTQITDQAAETSALPKTHKVQKGEVMWKIAEKYYNSGYNFVDIQKANKIANANLIEVGQELTIPDVESKKPTVLIAKTPDGSPTQTKTVSVNSSQITKEQPSIQGNTYNTVKGDHLWNIAIRAYGDGYKWVEIAKNNNIKNPNLIFVNQEIKLQR